MPQGKYKNKTYPLRIDDEIMSQLKIIAKNEDRTLNKQIERILRQWLQNYNIMEVENAEHKTSSCNQNE